MNHVPLEELEAAALGELSTARKMKVAEHAAVCGECAREMAWIRAERALLARRPPPETGHLWAGIEAQLTHPRRRPHWARRISVAVVGAVAAAAMVVLATRPRPVAPVQPPAPIARRTPPVLDPKTLAALDRAEADYRDAAKVLEAEYAGIRSHLDPALAKRWDETLTRARAQLGESRSVAANDVNARMRVLDGYAGYLRSLRDVLQDSEEATP